MNTDSLAKMCLKQLVIAYVFTQMNVISDKLKNSHSNNLPATASVTRIYSPHNILFISKSVEAMTIMADVLGRGFCLICHSVRRKLLSVQSLCEK